MIRRLIVIAGVCLAASAAAGTARAQDTSARARACSAGATTVGGLVKRTFCGGAKAVVRVAGKTLTLTQGQCVATPKYLSVNIGALYLGRTTKSKPNYFGLDVGRVPGTNALPAGKDGTYKSGIDFTVNYGNASYLILGGATVTLKGNRSQGTISGKTITGDELDATFHC
jgi:hypothetical protein